MNHDSNDQRPALADCELSLDVVVTAYLKAVDAGEVPDRQVWRDRNPALAAELNEFFSDMDRMNGLATPLRAILPPDGRRPTAAVPDQPPPDGFLGELGDYVLLREVGRGGMGIVYEAEQRSLRRRVALKTLPFAATMDPKQLLRFRNEALAAASLHHEHIVPVYAVGCERGVHFYAMQFIDGQTLAQLIRTLRDGAANQPADAPDVDATGAYQPGGATATLPLVALSTEHSGPRGREFYRTAAQLLAQAADALEHAHALGIVHRDVKPGNLLVDPAGKVWVADFGLARFGPDAGLTQSGDLLGTLRYMAPEQALARHGLVDHRADVYGLGATLYELLTGQPAVNATERAEILRQIAFEEPMAPRKLVKSIPAELETVTLKCLAKNPNERYQSAGELAQDLQRFIEDRPVLARRPTLAERAWRWGRRNPGLAAGLATTAAALLIGTVVSTAFGVHASQQATRADKEATRAGLEATRATLRAEEERKAKHEAERLWRLMAVDRGVREADEGRVFLGLLWQAQPLVGATDGEGRNAQAVDRVLSYRLMAQPRLPTLVGLWQFRDTMRKDSFSPDGRRLFTFGKDWAWALDAETGRPLAPPLQHANRVNSAAFSTDGRRVVTASWDNTARVWDAQTSQPLTPPLQHGNRVNSAAFSADGHRVVTASLDGTARVWDVQTGQSLTPPIMHARVTFAALSPDGQRVVTASLDGTARVWNTQTGEPLTQPLKHAEPLQAAAFSPDGRRVLTTGGRRSAQVWDAETGQPITPPLKHDPAPTDYIFSLEAAAFSPDGRRVLTHSWDRTARIWDAETGRPLVPPLLHTGTVWSAAFSPDGRRVVTASDDRTARVWDAQTGQPLTPVLQHTAPVRIAAFSAGGRRVLTSSAGTIRVWDLEAVQLPAPTLQHAGAVRGVAFSPDGLRVLTGSEDKTAQVWDALTGQPLTPPLLHTGTVWSAAFSPDGRRVATASYDKTARVWDAQTGQPVTQEMKHKSWVWRVRFSPDGRRVATASRDTTARVWDAQTGQPVTPELKHMSAVQFAQFSPDSRRVVTLADDETARIWDAETGQLLIPPLKQAASVQAEFSRDGRWLLTSGAAGTARVWDAQTGQVRTTLRHVGLVLCAFSPDGRKVVTGGEDQTARVWDAETGELLTSPMKHADNVMGVAFSPDGRRVLTGSLDRTARVWDAETGRPLTPPLTHTDIVWAVAFSPDGRRVVTGSLDKTARVWELPTDQRPAEDVVRLTRLLCGHRIDNNGYVATLSAAELQTLWDDLRKRYPADFAVSPVGARAWRQREIGDCLREGNFKAAEFHYWWLVAEMARRHDAK